MAQSKSNNKQQQHVDFRKLTKEEADKLSQKWEKDAAIFEKKLQSYMSNPNPNPEKVDRLWKVGNQLWNRLRKLENYRKKHNL